MAEYVELFIDQGSDFSTTINLNDDNTNLPQNVYGYSVSSSLRRSLVSPNSSANLSCSVYDASNGEFLITLSSANTANLRPGPYFFDVKVTDTSSTVTRLIEGVIYVTPSITR